MEENLRLWIDWTSLIVRRKLTVFALFYFVFERNFPSTSPQGAFFWRGDLTEGFLCHRFGGPILIFGGAYTWRGLFSEFCGMSKWQRRTVYDRCYSSNSYPQKCEIYFQVKKLELNESACKRPLVETEHNSSWYEGIEGCGIQCENPIFTTVEHTRIHRFVGAFGSLSFICSLFTMVCHQPSLITAPSTRGVGTCLSFKLTFYDLNQIVNIFIIHLRIKISKKS